MTDAGIAKLFKHGRSQAVRLPRSFRLPGTQVRVRRVGRGVLLEPIEHEEDIKAAFVEIDRWAARTSYPKGAEAAIDAASVRYLKNPLPRHQRGDRGDQSTPAERGAPA
jgi:antitoxin VapB